MFHLAAQIDVRRSVADPAYDLGINVGGTLALLERLREQGSGKLVFASTGGAIYGEGNGRDLPLAEDAECQPEAPYGQSKLAAEGYLGLYRRMYGIDAVAMRLGNVYGPRQDPLGEAGVVAIFCNAMNTGTTPKVFGDGEQTRDYVYVGDVAAAFIAGAEAKTPGPFNVGTGVETSVLELGESLAEVAGASFDPELAPSRPGRGPADRDRLVAGGGRARLERREGPARRASPPLGPGSKRPPSLGTMRQFYGARRRHRLLPLRGAAARLPRPRCASTRPASPCA